ncbi:antibiotic biosynthesis monooxygenase family protein [Sinomonas terrae]|jgi:heme-degrading monooxygenase HmoA|uniref:Antibiotic biosynthesis monooxygenase n=1 Tax=Sinomonas terrae TaxID=2908838 RepID=A0ABS9U0L2_9MICC|nr:antibiotic biosynthesis monooxygenase family protein [Sinomonas terrae]MCH6469855.1 antibiotic biosynthesis monooxygenase [Sinomonas terrae]
MADAYASGRWHVQPGKEEEFIARWREFLEWTQQHHPAMVDSSLLQEVTTSTEFVSFSEWKDAESRDQWKRDPGFAEKIGACRELCERMVGKDYARVVRIP